MPARITCVARGATGIEEGFAALDSSRVQFMLIKFPVGSGTFKRNKFVYVHFIGPQCSIVKRGKWNAELANVLELFKTSAGVEVTEKESLTFDFLVSRLEKVFVSDKGKFSVAAVKEEFNRRVEEERVKLLAARGGSSGGGGTDAGGDDGAPTSPIRKRKLAVELGLKADSVLKAIREDMGPFNWCVFDPNPKELTLREGGSNGLFELVEFLPDDGILFGLVRVGFGTGRFRRTKLIFFHWCGDAASAVKKGRSNEMSAAMLQLLGPANAELKLNGAEECTVSSILAKLQNVFVVDHIKVNKDEKKKAQEAAFSEEKYIEALLEEQERAREFYNEPEDAGDNAQSSTKSSAGPAEFDVTETLQLIRQDEGGLLWGIFQCA